MRDNKLTKDDCNTIKFLIHRWKKLSPYASLETLENLGYQALDKNSTAKMIIKQVKPINQIEKIKKNIIDILPAAECISPKYNPNVELTIDDFIMLFVEHQNISIDKILKIMEYQHASSNM